ncbi:hypothetical protein EDC17_103224 [Sphingobacterium alimentarium]|uniref:Glycosyltransferase 2-like domain-containing protein n=1 Tax=Sphingobacterium alimentarium TaxID=797292 RepID=A0A4R3VRN1_9SPHI|nr:glycosyltransferase family 2 protein [Sphingobacterium alimentarium]TCV10492.1 hypothetical protein EDC17_103224 [Sphingobacterium alimentarium]
MDKNLYFIIVLNWNGWSDTKLCLESIVSNSKSDNFRVILVDNGSQSEEIETIEEYCRKTYKVYVSDIKENFLSPNYQLGEDFIVNGGKDKLIFIKNNENLGFAKGNNIAVEFVQNLGGQYVLLLNNDTEIEDDALNKMMEILIGDQTNKVAAVIPQIRYFRNKNIIWNCGGKINALGIRKYYYADADVKNVPQKGTMFVDYGTGCTILMDLHKTDRLSEKFFFGEEDLELALRLKKRGFKTVCLLDAIVYHKVGASRDKFSDKFIGNMVYHYAQRLSNLKDNLNPVYWRITVVAHVLSSIRLLLANKKFSLKIAWNMWKDILDNVNNLEKFTQADFARISRKVY